MTARQQDIHAYFEPGFPENRTSVPVAAKLEACGCDDGHRGIGRSGVVDVLPGGSCTRAIGLRAGLDTGRILEVKRFGH